MNHPITASISYPYDERILQLFEPEKKEFDRAAYLITTHGVQLVFTIKATDATALRAALTTITKILSVWEATNTNGSQRKTHN
jgi:tRNA threonylcarbamoyladenosine modification (KEOPS) complex  Pcc1 subunit